MRVLQSLKSVFGVRRASGLITQLAELELHHASQALIIFNDQYESRAHFEVVLFATVEVARRLASTIIFGRDVFHRPVAYRPGVAAIHWSVFAGTVMPIPNGPG